MLMKNVWQSMGLYNGALGTVRGILYSEGRTPLSQPICVFVEFDDYRGPSLCREHPKLVPVVSEVVQFDPRSGKTGSTQQLPLTLRWAITIHKSQGFTLRRAVLSIGDGELAFGVTYVGCSRVRSYKDLAFQTSFTWERLQKINVAKKMEIVRREIARLNTLGPL
jgi:ATP-dependent exoDNAse (exonuclease V) alpha subunit